MPRAVNFLALSGLSPAVVSETIWVLLTRRIKIATITIVTTAAGAALVERDLIGPDRALSILFRDHAEGVACPATAVVILRGATGDILSDISSADDHLAVTETISTLVRDLTSAEAAPLHASLAGGRKTMGAALTVAMCLHARPEDRLSHVLADPLLESDPAFLFPASYGADGLQLADIPFPRLRPLLADAARKEPTTRLIAGLQRRLDGDGGVTVDLTRREIRTEWGNLRLPPLQCAVYALMASRAARDSQGLTLAEFDPARLKDFYRRAGADQASAEALALRLTRDDPQPWLREQFARIGAELRRGFGPALAAELGVLRSGRRPATRYRLGLSAHRITVVG